MAALNEINLTLAVNGEAAASVAVENLKKQINSLGNETKSATGVMESSWAKMATAFTAGNLIAKGIEQILSLIARIPSLVLSAVNAIDSLKISTIQIAAQITTMQGPKNVAEHYKAATVYAEALSKKLQEVDANSFANYQTLLQMTQTMTLQGVILDVNNKKQVEAFTALSNAVAMYTAGQNQSVQSHQEIRALMSGEITQGSMLARQMDELAKASGLYKGGLKELVAEGKKHGDMLERMAPFLVGINAASGDISKTWQAVTSSLETAYGILQRAFFKDFFNEATTQGGGFVNWLKSSEATVTAWGKNFMRILYSISAEIIRMGMLLDKTGGTATSAQMLLYGPGKALGVKSSTERFDRAAQNNIDFENRYNEKSTMLENLAIKMNKLDDVAAAASKSVLPKVNPMAGDDKKLKLTAEQKEYQKQIKEFLKTAWDKAALELAAEDFSSDMYKKLGITGHGPYKLTDKPLVMPKSPALNLGTATLQSLEEQAAANKKLEEAEASRLAVENELLAVQKIVNDLDKDTARLKTSMLDDPYERQMQSMIDRYEAERKQIQLTMDKHKDSQSIQTAGTKKLTELEHKQIKDTKTLDDQSFKGRLSIASQYTSMAGQMFSALAQTQDTTSRSGFESAKALNIAAAIMSTASAIMAQLTIPGPAGWASAAMAGVMGAIQIATIASTSFGGGGSAPTIPSGSFGGGGASQGAVGGSIGAPVQSVRDSLSQDTMISIAGSMENASLALGKVADGLTRVTDLFKDGSFMSMAAGAAPGMNATNDYIKTKASANATILGFNDFMKNWNDWGKATSSVFSAIGYVLFGGSYQNKSTGIDLGMTGGKVSNSNYTEQYKAGGLFSGGSTRYITSAGDQGFTNSLQSSLNQVISTVIRSAVVMGTTANIGAANLGSTRIATSGRTQEAIQKDLEAWFTNASNTLAKTVAGLQDFAFFGENAFDALVRLSTALQSANEGLSLINGNLFNASLSGANAAWKLQTMMGGAEAFTTAVDTYFSSMFTDQQQAAAKSVQAQRQVNVAFAEIGLAVPQTKEEFKALVSSLNLTSDSGASTFAALMDISTAFATVQDHLAKLAETTAAFSNDLTAREMTLAGLVGGVDLFNLRIQQEQEMKQAQLDGMDTTRLLTVQNQEWALAVAKATGVVTDSITKLVDAAKAAVTSMLDAQIAIANSMKTIMTGPLANLSPEAAYNQAQARFAAIQGKTDLASLQAMPEVANALLTASKSYNASGIAYQTDLDNVLEAMNLAIGGTGDPTLELVESQLKVLQDIRTALTTGALITALGTSGTLATLLGAFNAATATALAAETMSAAKQDYLRAQNTYDTVQYKAYSDVMSQAKSGYVSGTISETTANQQISGAYNKLNPDYQNLMNLYNKAIGLGVTGLIAPSQLGAIGIIDAIDKAKVDINMQTMAKTDASIKTTDKVTGYPHIYAGAYAPMSVIAMMDGNLPIDLRYDLNKDGAITQSDYLLWSQIAAGYLKYSSLGLPAFASGGIAYGPSIFGEAGPEAAVPLPDGRRIPVMLSGSADNKELIDEIKALRAEVRAGVNVNKTGFSETIAISKQQARSSETIANSSRLVANS